MADRPSVPKGCERIAPNVYASATEIIVEGTPSVCDDESSPEYHNCDAMGCGWAHVIYRASLASPSFRDRETRDGGPE